MDNKLPVLVEETAQCTIGIGGATLGGLQCITYPSVHLLCYPPYISEHLQWPSLPSTTLPLSGARGSAVMSMHWTFSPKSGTKVPEKVIFSESMRLLALKGPSRGLGSVVSLPLRIAPNVAQSSHNCIVTPLDHCLCFAHLPLLLLLLPFPGVEKGAGETQLVHHNIKWTPFAQCFRCHKVLGWP